ncbi:hypothetical protein GALMADRAFT_70957 [Galerina marginata CBS 339.88]|uniref:Uncharacterized protein n=1 Tax=Galerina marginata (strain CBS 339.88) TaxID=685588 RepID=A0A067STS4_GALM3|nr:hypothetical protein GALMADRAFT_70957 [Galerina marginata CBS 339.88]
MRRSPPLGQVTRLLPTPPHPNPPNFTDDRRLSPPPGPQQSLSQPNVNSHYGRPPLRAPTAAYPNKFQELESQMTPEFFADIDRAAEQQQAQYQSHQTHSYPSAIRGESPSPPKGPAVDRARAPAERSSPSNPEVVQRGRREQLVARESPKTRDRQPASPIASSFAQAQLQAHSPERRTPPGQHSPLVMAGEPHPASYLAQYNARESPPVVRRAPNSEPRLNVSMASQTPPLQTIAARTPDRSLPVQEEDEVTSKNGSSAGTNWQVNEEIVEPPFQSPSPTPSSDLNPDGNNQRFETSQVNNHQPVHRDDEKAALKQHEDAHAQYVERDSTEEEGGYTPRSPTAGLPEEKREMYYSGQNIPIRVPVPVVHRGKARNGSSDHLMRGLESTLLDQQTSAPPQQQPQPTERPPQYVDQRQPTQGNTHQYQNYPPPQEYGYSHGPQRDHKYVPPQVYPDDFQSYGEDSTSAYIQSYIQSPRPDAPIPPTPHSQTAAPSPSPMLSGYGGKELPAYRPMRAAGSPYPFPFGHVRRNRQVQNPRFFPNGLDPSNLTEKIARQWQVYAQNNQGNITDSTLSPSTTPFQPELFDHWAYLHTARMMGNGMLDTASMQSSPSHQPVALPIAPNFSVKKKERHIHSKRQAYNRKPPPRVESTQPRETSPELSSSGEETAGEERYTSTSVTEVMPADPLPFPIAKPMTPDVDDNGDWVDEDDEDDYEDLIDLEYHPAFVKNVTKRRRKWEVGWENLIQAFQALDRQTDATMVLLASPSHTTKLHALRSRSIRRQSMLASSVNIDQIRSGFARMAAQRRATRPDKSSLVDRLMVSSGSSGGDGSDGSSTSVEGNLRRALDAALGSLGAMGEVYEQREARVLEELQRSREDRERVELLLRQVLGDKHPLSNPSRVPPHDTAVV